MKTIRIPFFLCGLAIFITMSCSASKTVPLGPVLPESDDPAVIAQQYRESYDKWQAKNLTAYTMVLSYGAHSPTAGSWELDISNGRVTRRVFEGKLQSDDSAAMNNMNMERLFELASPATSERRDGPFIIRAAFYRDGGIASVRRVRNPAATGTVPRDATWAYMVSEIRDNR